MMEKRKYNISSLQGSNTIMKFLTEKLGVLRDVDLFGVIMLVFELHRECPQLMPYFALLPYDHHILNDHA
jgi:hypothetical protein